MCPGTLGTNNGECPARSLPHSPPPPLPLTHIFGKTPPPCRNNSLRWGRSDPEPWDRMRTGLGHLSEGTAEVTRSGWVWAQVTAPVGTDRSGGAWDPLSTDPQGETALCFATAHHQGGSEGMRAQMAQMPPSPLKPV